jgi:hydroxymethylglutaryl-CoA lyase
MAKKPAFSVFDVGPRDGIQNEPGLLALKDKLALVNGLIEAGVRDLELGAFVRPDRVPQMADTEQLYAAIRAGKLKLGRTRAWSLVPNRKGMERAIAAGATHVAVFTAATDSFAERNIGKTVKQSLVEFQEVMALAREHAIQVRGYVSTAFGCPFEGKVAASKPNRVIDALVRLGVDSVLGPALKSHGEGKIAGHFHDTRGTALANALRAIEIGVRCLDASAGGLGGCPFAPGATGNLATEDLIYMLDGMGISTGIDLKRLSDTSIKLARVMNRPLSSRYLQAYSKK